MAGGTSRSSVALKRPSLDEDAVLFEVCDRIDDAPRPYEAKVAVARLHWTFCVETDEARAMDSELPVAKPILAPPLVVRGDLRTENAAIERVCNVPVRNGNYAVVEPELLHAPRACQQDKRLAWASVRQCHLSSPGGKSVVRLGAPYRFSSCCAAPSTGGIHFSRRFTQTSASGVRSNGA